MTLLGKEVKFEGDDFVYKIVGINDTGDRGICLSAKPLNGILGEPEG